MKYPFQNPDLPLEERVNDLVSRFTLDEKIELMCQYQAEIPVSACKNINMAPKALTAWHGLAKQPCSRKIPGLRAPGIPS